MNKTNPFTKIGITLLIIGAIFLILNKTLENETIISITSYGRYVFIAGGAFLGIGLFGKYTSKEK